MSSKILHFFKAPWMQNKKGLQNCVATVTQAENKTSLLKKAVCVSAVKNLKELQSPKKETISPITSAKQFSFHCHKKYNFKTTAYCANACHKDTSNSLGLSHYLLFIRKLYVRGCIIAEKMIFIWFPWFIAQQAPGVSSYILIKTLRVKLMSNNSNSINTIMECLTVEMRWKCQRTK